MSAVQQYNSEMVSLLKGDFQGRDEPNFAIANAVSTFKMLPELRGLWTFSSVNESGDILDFSEQGRTLTNNGTAPRAVSGLVPYASLNGTTQYFSRADEAGLDITGNLTFGGWFQIGSLPPAVAYGLITKDNFAAGRSYRLSITATPEYALFIDRLGDATSRNAIGSSVAPVINSWVFVSGRFVPSTSVSIMVNGVIDTDTVGIVASCFNSGTALEIGRVGLNNAYCLFGKTAVCYLCAAAHSDAVWMNTFEQTRSAFGV